MPGENAAINVPLFPQTAPALLTLALIRQHYVPAGERTLHRWISSGTFPRPDIAIGGKVRYWRRETVEGWIASQSAGGGQ
jgi:predicted DNA-binding transcriptional regulator AlpA